MNKQTTNVLTFAKEYESLDDYNFLKWGTMIGLPQDLFKKLVPNYEELEGKEYEITMKVCSTLIRELQANNRIVITDKEKAEIERLKQVEEQKENDLAELSVIYGNKNARVLMSNVMTAYGNAGKPKGDYHTAKKWCEEQGIYDEIERRALGI
ncbi:hypothetical protein [Vagococcus sp.]|uniref:hypothetical protein n=1 Tax=Vagococcus sp. TaxID=1933889 RepID=UPI003F94D61A